MRCIPVLSLVSLLAGPALAQMPAPNPIPCSPPRASWVLTPGVSGTPSQRRDNPGAASKDRLYLFGGRDQNAGTTVLNALYEFDGSRWTLRTAEGAPGSPPARGGACVAWDWGRTKLVVFGGDTGGASPVLLGDTWEWDPATNAWAQVNPPVWPSPRRWAAMAFDPGTGGMLLFGGEVAITTPPSPPSNETWLFLRGIWLRLNPATVPPPRRMHSLATRPDFGDVFLCAGSDPSQTPEVRLLDAWRWTGNGWTAFQAKTFPHGTTANQAVYDEARKRIVLQGGQGISVPNTAGGGQYGDLYGGSPSTWCSEFDCLSDDWRLYGAAAFGTADPVIGRVSRYFAGYIPALGKVYKAGGQNPSGTGTITGTCEYQAKPAAQSAAFGAGCQGLALGPVFPGDRPWLGRTYNAAATGLAGQSLAIGVLGLAPQQIPLALLHPAGGPGCTLYAELKILVVLGNAGGSAAFILSIPNDTVLAGARLHQQVLEIQVSGGTLSSFTATNGLALTLGAL